MKSVIFHFFKDLIICYKYRNCRRSKMIQKKANSKIYWIKNESSFCKIPLKKLLRSWVSLSSNDDICKWIFTELFIHDWCHTVCQVRQSSGQQMQRVNKRINIITLIRLFAKMTEQIVWVNKDVFHWYNSHIYLSNHICFAQFRSR